MKLYYSKSASKLYDQQSLLPILKCIGYTIALFCFSQTLPAQNSPSIAWQKSLGGSDREIATYVQQTADGGYISGGHSQSNDGDVSGNHGGDDYWIAKVDALGNLEWEKSLGGSDNEHSRASYQTSDGGFVMVGESHSNDGDVSGNHGESDLWVVKLDTSGNVEWQKSFGGSGADIGNSVQQTADGGYIVAGYAESTDGDVTGNHGEEDNWVLRLDSHGNLIWEKCLGGSDGDYGYYIRQTSDGGYILGSATESDDGDVTENHGVDDYWIAKLDTSGNIVWEKSYGGSEDDRVNAVQQTTDGGYVVAGGAVSDDGDVVGSHGSREAWIIKLDADGNLVWQNPLGGSNQEGATAIEQTADGGYIVGAYASSDDGEVSGMHGVRDYWVVKLDAGGNLIWQKCLGGTAWDQPNSISQAADGGYVVSGFSESNDDDVSGNHGDWDFWVVKLNCDQIFYADADGDGYGNASSTITGDCNVAPVGYVQDSTDCDDNNASTYSGAIEVCNGVDDNCDGNVDEGVLLTFYADADSDNYGNANNTALGCSPPNGFITDNTDCDDNNPNVNPGALEIPNNGIDDNCNGEIDEIGTGISSIGDDAFSLSVFPNPTDGAFVTYLKLSDEANGEATLEVLNMLGQKMYSQKAQLVKGMLQKEIQLNDAATEGMCLVKVIVNDRVYSAQINFQK